MTRQQILLVLRGVAAALVLAGGIIHFKLWNDVYRDHHTIGPMFVLNAIGSALVAIALVAWPPSRRDEQWLPVLGGLAVTNGTLLAFALSRTGEAGFLGFREYGWNPSPETALALAFELGAAVVLLAALWLALLPREDTIADRMARWEAGRPG